MKRFTVNPDDEKPIKFEGELLAEADGKGFYGDSQNRWYTLKLFRTKGGSYVCHRHYTSIWQGEKCTSEVIVCDSDASVIDFYGQNDLAKELYDEAGIENGELIR